MDYYKCCIKIRQGNQFTVAYWLHSSLTTFRCFDNGYLEKQPVVWKGYCAEYWLKKFQESMDRCTGRRDITEILLNTTLNTIKSITIACMHYIITRSLKAKNFPYNSWFSSYRLRLTILCTKNKICARSRTWKVLIISSR